VEDGNDIQSKPISRPRIWIESYVIGMRSDFCTMTWSRPIDDHTMARPLTPRNDSSRA
jgi:hypothetical protein